MDRNVALAVFFLFLIIADVSNAKRSRHLAPDPSNNNSASTQDSGENKLDPKPVEAGEKPENVQATNGSSNLDPKTDLVSPLLQNQTTDNSKNLDSTNSGSLPVDKQTMNNDKRHLNGTDLPSAYLGNESDNGKNGGNKERNVNDKSRINGTDLLSPDPGNETDSGKNGGNKDKNINDKSRLNGTDLLSLFPINKTDNGNNGGKKENSINDKSRLNGTDLLTPFPVNKTDDVKNGRNKEKGIDDESSLNGTDLLSPFPVNKTDNGKNGGNKEDKSSLESGVTETCEGLPKCTDLKTLVACIQNFDTGSREFTVLVQNGGEKTLRVNFVISTAVENPPKPIEISKHDRQKVKLSLSVAESTKLILDAGNGECVLHMDPCESDENLFVYLPSYDKLVTPINGAYFLIFSVIVFGGTWACCKFRKRRPHDGVAYQELEMGLPESVSATNTETAEDWDQGWDEDWNDENAVKSPGAPRIGNISANGLTSRSPNRDWDHDWDD